jgi:uncharacterized protein YozE (UPF0346 family)
MDQQLQYVTTRDRDQKYRLAGLITSNTMFPKELSRRIFSLARETSASMCAKGIALMIKRNEFPVRQMNFAYFVNEKHTVGIHIIMAPSNKFRVKFSLSRFNTVFDSGRWMEMPYHAEKSEIEIKNRIPEVISSVVENMLTRAFPKGDFPHHENVLECIRYYHEHKDEFDETLRIKRTVKNHPLLHALESMLLMAME